MSLITVFTPTYNRACLLPRCYESMKRQTNQDFVWMVIDDGSIDNTKALCNQWINEKHGFSMEYYYKENGGLHTAYNEAISHIETLLAVCIDSDDWMPEDAIDRILKFWKENGSEKYAGIIGLDCYADGTTIGDKLPNQKSINWIDLMTGKYRIKNGDRTNVVRTALYKTFGPMKEFPGEKNFNPHYLHLQISKQFDFLVLNENLHFVEYQDDGMSSSILKQYKFSPNSFAELRLLYLSFYETNLIFRLRQAVHLISSGILARNLKDVIQRSPRKIETVLAIPFGWVLSVYICYKTRT